jgi:hypothetical protein
MEHSHGTFAPSRFPSRLRVQEAGNPDHQDLRILFIEGYISTRGLDAILMMTPKSVINGE